MIITQRIRTEQIGTRTLRDGGKNEEKKPKPRTGQRPNQAVYLDSFDELDFPSEQEIAW